MNLVGEEKPRQGTDPCRVVDNRRLLITRLDTTVKSTMKHVYLTA